MNNNYYAKLILHASNDWIKFTGMVMLVGIEMNLSFEQITEYVFETYHQGEDIKDTPQTEKELREDMTLYFKEV